MSDLTTWLHEFADACEIVAAGKWPGPRTAARLREVAAALAAAQQRQAMGCHCATCTCDPNMTPAVRFDTSPAAQEGVIRDHLIALGWTPPGVSEQKKLRVGNLPGLTNSEYPGLGDWWIQLWDEDEVFARAFGASPEEARRRAERIRDALAQQSAAPVLAKHQPCGCVICTCEDEKQCQGCGAKHCGNRVDHPPYITQQPAAVERCYHPCTHILIDGLKRLEGGAAVLAEWDRARAKADGRG